MFFVPQLSICDIKSATIRVKFVDPDGAEITAVEVPLASDKYGQMIKKAKSPATSQGAYGTSDEAEESEPQCAAL